MVPWVQTNVIPTVLNFLPASWITSSLCSGVAKAGTVDATCTVKYLEYIIFGLVGGIIGAIIDSR